MRAELRAVLITGGTGKLGRSFLEGFSKAGHPVAFTTRVAARAAALREQCLAWGAPGAWAIEADLTSPDGISQVEGALDVHGLRPAILVNNARNVENLRPDADGFMPRERWLAEFDLGVFGAYALTVKLARTGDTRLDAVVNIASMYGVTAANRSLYEDPARDSPIHYGVVKAAVIHLTKELAVRLAPAVRVNAVSFGGVSGRVPPAFAARYAALCPSGRMLADDEVFGPVRFLAGVESSGLTGHNLVADGGWTIW